MILRWEVLNFHISGSITCKKALEMGNVLWFMLLLKIKFILMRQIEKFLRADYIPLSFTDMRHDMSTCVTTMIVVDSFDDFLTDSFEFSYLWFYKA